MGNLKFLKVAAISLGVAALALPAAASAAITFTNTIAGATTGTGPYTLTSTDSTFSILRFINNETFDFGDLTSLELDYNVLLGGVGGGAPRIVVVTDADQFLVVEGNYLLLDQAPWADLAPFFDLTVLITVPEAELDRRLLDRWAHFGKSPAAARAWIDGNDMPNIRRVQAGSRAADVQIEWPAA